MPHGLDHIVHAVRDLDAAAEFYRDAGFTVGARNRHPWGTHNRIVQLKNCYIEILEVAEPEKIVPHGARSFSFGAFNRDFLASRQGFSMLILNSSNAADDARAFEAAGIGGYDVFNFARDGAKPEGTPVKLAFSLVFASDPASPNLGFAACQHHFPHKQIIVVRQFSNFGQGDPACHLITHAPVRVVAQAGKKIRTKALRDFQSNSCIWICRHLQEPIVLDALRYHTPDFRLLIKNHAHQ